MKLATLHAGEHTTAAVLVNAETAYMPLPYPDLGTMLADPQWRETTAAAMKHTPHSTNLIAADSANFAALLPAANKVICCGLNYSNHIQEMGRDLPEHPTLFAKFADTLTGAHDTITALGSTQVDWEAELAVVVGSTLSHANATQAAQAIAGFTVANDVSMRDWQNRTLQWFQGKAFDASTPVGPVMLTADEANGGFEVRGYVNGELVQSDNSSTLVFGPAQLLAYISQFTVLRAGDLVLTGTPGGVGMGMKPPRFLQDGDLLTTEILGIGRLENRIRIHPLPHHTPTTRQ